MSEHNRPVKKSAAPGRRVSSGSVRSTGNSSRSRNDKRSVKRNYMSKRRIGKWDADVVLTLVLICFLIVGIAWLVLSGINSRGGCSCGGKTQVLDMGASIRSQEEIDAENAAKEEEARLQAEQKAAAQKAAEEAQNAVVTEATAEAAAEVTATAEVTAAATAVPAATATTAYKSDGTLRSATIRTAGDFVIHEPIINASKVLGQTSTVKYEFGPMLQYISSVLQNADFTVTNVDGSMGGKYKYGYTGYPQFNTPPHLMYALVDCGVDMLTLANNHMLDGWFDGLLYEIDNVESVGLKHVGAYRTQEERNTPVIYEVNGIKIGFMNYTCSLNSMESRGVDQKALDYGAGWIRNSNCKTDAKALRDAGAEVIVCYMHWGTEYEQDPDDNELYLAKQLVEAGVDVIMGGHPHVVQPATWLSGTNQFGEHQDTLCVYSVGNFLSDQRTSPRDGGIIFDFTIQENSDGSFSIVNPCYLPIWDWRTGSEDAGYTYYVLPIGQYIDNKPSGMSSSDYSAMMASYNNSVSTMNQGVGTLITK